MADNVVSAFVEAMEDAATKAVLHAERLTVEAERLLNLSGQLRQQAEALRAGVATLQGRPAPPVSEPAPAPVAPPVREPEPPAPVEESAPKIEAVKASGKKGVVTSSMALAAATRLGHFSRLGLARELGLSPIAVSKFITALEKANAIRTEGGEYVFQGTDAIREPEPTESEVSSNLGRGTEKAREQGQASRAAILAYITEHAPVPLGDVVQGTGISQAVVSRHLRVLMDEGEVTKTGLMKSARYHAASPAPTPAPTKPQETEQSRAEEALLVDVRDWFVERTKEFTPRQCAEALDLPVEAVKGAFDHFVERGVLIDESPAPDMPLFSYARPLEAGKAAEADRAQAKAQAKAAPSTKGAPVPGTGKGVKANNPDVQALINACQSAGAEVTHATNGHFEVKFEGKRVLIAATPRGQRTVMNDRARLRRKGLTV